MQCYGGDSGRGTLASPRPSLVSRMDFATAVSTCFEKYATFAGRASRAEFWYFVVFSLGGTGVGFLIDEAVFAADGWSPIGSAFSLATFLPSMAVGARRLHDIGKSGWLQLNGLVPLLGWIFLILWVYKPGMVGANRYGADPLSADQREEEEADADDGSAERAERVMARFAERLQTHGNRGFHRCTDA